MHQPTWLAELCHTPKARPPEIRPPTCCKLPGGRKGVPWRVPIVYPGSSVSWWKSPHLFLLVCLPPGFDPLRLQPLNCT